MFKLKLTARAERELKQISKQYQRKALVEAFLEIKEDPLIGKPLDRELIQKYSYRFRVYRIIYLVNQKDKTITIVTAGHRSTIYKLPKKS